MQRTKTGVFALSIKTRSDPVLTILVFLSLGSIVACTPPAAAQTSGTAQIDSVKTSRAVNEHSVPSKSPTRAFLYSAGGTVLPVAVGSALAYAGARSPNGPTALLFGLGSKVVAAGLVAGPAAGHIYAKDWTQAGLGMGIRGGAALVGGAAATIIAIDVIAHSFIRFLLPLRSDYEPSRASRIAEDVLIGAGIAAGGSALFDIVTAPRSARKYNEKNDLRVHLTPRVQPVRDQFGLTVRLQF